MEEIYLKNVDHEWHSRKVDLLRYFESFSDSYCKIMKRNNMSLGNIFQSVLGEDTNMDQKEVANFIQDMSEIENKFKCTLPSLKTLGKMKNQQANRAKTDVFKTSNLKGAQPEKSLETHHENLESKEPADNVLQGNSSQNPQEEQADNSQQQCVKDKIKEIYITNTRNSPLSNPSLNILKVRELTKTKQAKYKKSILTTRSELLLNNTIDKSSKTNLKRGNHFVVSFRIHEPFAHRGEKSKVEHFQQEILVLGHQTLTELRDKIVCQSDFQDVRGDVSHDPDSLVTVLTRDKYNSAMFYFDNTFYTDERGDQDYSEVIRRWALPRGINVGVTRSMGTARVSDLRVRLGYPYVYTHQGSCEHLVIVSDARLLAGRDSLHSSDYPLISRIPRPITKYCFTCLRVPAKWIVLGCDRLPKNVSYMCKNCFKSYNYLGGKKIGNFKAYRFFQKNLLL